MPEMHFTITDNSGVFKAAKGEAIARAMESVGLFLEGEAADELENDPRRVDTGRLKGSIGHDSDETRVVVGTNLGNEYGIYVHEGTRRMAPNRFLRNAFERNLDQVKEYIINELKSG